MKKSPINNMQQLLAITAEECGELTQACMKIMRMNNTKQAMFDNQEYYNSLLDEVGDVACMIGLLIEHGFVDEDVITNRAMAKREKLRQWSTLVND